MSNVVRVNERDEVIKGGQHCYTSEAAALRASKRATAEPRAWQLWDTEAKRYCYLGAGERSAALASPSYLGVGQKIVKVIDV